MLEFQLILLSRVGAAQEMKTSKQKSHKLSSYEDTLNFNADYGDDALQCIAMVRTDGAAGPMTTFEAGRPGRQ